MLRFRIYFKYKADRIWSIRKGEESGLTPCFWPEQVIVELFLEIGDLWGDERACVHMCVRWGNQAFWFCLYLRPLLARMEAS